MKVLTVVPLPPGPRGGIEDYAGSVLQGLQGKAELDVLAPAEAGQEIQTDSGWSSGSQHLVPARWMFRRLLPTGRRARSSVEACVGRADVVHLHMPCPRLEAWTAIAAVRSGVPLIATYHMDAIYDGGDLDAVPGAPGRALGWLYDSLSARPALARSRVIVTNSIRYANESRLLPSFVGKVRAIHQGVSPSHTVSKDGGASLRQEFTKGRGSLVTFLGRLV